MVLTIENIGTRKEEFRWQELTRDVEQYLPRHSCLHRLTFCGPASYKSWFTVAYADRRGKPSILTTLVNLIVPFKYLIEETAFYAADIFNH